MTARTAAALRGWFPWAASDLGRYVTPPGKDVEEKVKDKIMYPDWYIQFCSTLNSKWNSTLSDRKVIFLDTNYYINFRECVQKREYDNINFLIYKNLLKLVKEQKVICPIIENVYFELLKRKNETDVIEVFKIVRELSNSLMQTSMITMCEFELCAFRDKIPNKLYVHKIQSQYCTFSLYDGTDQQKIENNKKCVERFLNEDIDQLFKLKLPVVDFYQQNYIEVLYQLMKFSINSNGKSTYKSLVELEKFELRSMIEELFLRHKDALNLNATFVDDVVNCREIAKYMPFVINSSKLNASIRWSELNNLAPNDIYDLISFPSAIGYSDYFFAEKKFTNRAKQLFSKFEHDYKTTVEYKREKILSILEKMSHNQ